MQKTKHTANRGITLTELMITIILTAIVISGIGVMLVDSQRGWYAMYDRIYADVVTDSAAAKQTFDAVIRKASWEKFFVDSQGSWIEVYYYEDDDSPTLDRYAHFFYQKDGGELRGQLNIEHGTLNPRKTLSVRPLCRNVSSCVFKATGRSAQMILTLDNGKQTATVVSSAVMHN